MRGISFMIKNPTPRQIAIYCAIILGIANFAIWLITQYVLKLELSLGLAIVISLIIILVGYFLFEEALEKYIYRKIKVIYKTIHRLKVAKDDSSRKVDLNEQIIDEVKKEVEDWADNYQKELDSLKNLEAYRRDFLGNISHELKTPIFNMQGYLLTLLDSELKDEKINLPYLKKASVNLDRLNTIVQDLEAISKLESGELQLELQEFNIRDLAAEVCFELEKMAEDKKISLKLKDSPNLDSIVLADREGIRQVLTNLITNSIKYGKEGGRTQIGFYDMDQNLLIEIADNGLGINQKHLPRLFERFYRVDKSRSRVQGGTGLGLSIVKHIIEGHKQTINVRSAEGMGSTFGFTLEKV